MAQANGLWMSQIARDLSDPVDGLFLGKRYLVHDRDPLFTAEFQDMLWEVGIESVKLPPHSLFGQLQDGYRRTAFQSGTRKLYGIPSPQTAPTRQT